MLTRFGELSAGEVYEVRAAIAQLEASQEDDDAFAEACPAVHLAVASGIQRELLDWIYRSRGRPS